MKKLLIILIVLVLLLAAVTVAQADTYVWLWGADGETYTVDQGESAGLYITWVTCNRGLARAFQNAVNIELTLDGAPLYQTMQNDPYWIFEWDAGEWEDCYPDENSRPTGVGWQISVQLPPGEYQIGYNIWLNNRLPDGFNSDGIGPPDFYEGVMQEGSFTLIFE